MGLKGILFDLDGTLIHFQIDYRRARAASIAILERAGYPSGIMTEEMFIIQIVERATEYFTKHTRLTSQEISKIRKEVDNVVAAVEYEAALHATPISGIIPVLQFLQDHQLSLGILTLNTSQNAQISINAAGLYSFFPDHRVIVGRDRVNNQKPHPDHPLFGLSMLELQAEEICIIGDHPSDIEAANNIHARSIAITTPKHPIADFRTPWGVPQMELYPALCEIISQFL